MIQSPPSGPFRAGERVQLTDPKGRLTTTWLTEGGQVHSQYGTIDHAAIIGIPDGSVVTSTGGMEYLALRPLLTDVIMSMPRGAAIIYPKDSAMILAKADIRPGARVVEAGVGSGALSLWLLRMLAGQGELVSFERREEFAEVARGNVASVYGGEPENWRIAIGDLQDALPREFEPGTVDRVILDMLAPWECLPAVAEAMIPGGVLVCYVATATQLSRVAEAIREHGGFTEPEADETMVRGWHVEGLAVRPDHRMVAHTGFLLTARRLAPGTTLPEKRKTSKVAGTDADREAWTPSDPEAWTEATVGERTVSDKVLRKRGRDAQRGAAHATRDSQAIIDPTATEGQDSL
jgi:tRNA (adenine57-N1/adenine58-N1)-methyltransferase